jgi:transcriptional regulator with XRE-family HTH domain
MSKEEFYRLSGISSATYSYWNTGKYNPTPKKLKSAAEVLGVTYEYLVTGEGQKEKPVPSEEDELDNELIYLLTKLHPEEITRVTAYIQGILDSRNDG